MPKKILKCQLALLLFKEAQKLIQYGLIYKFLDEYGDKYFCGENQQITPAFRAFNSHLNKVIYDIEISEAKCERYSELIRKIQTSEENTKK